MEIIATTLAICLGIVPSAFAQTNWVPLDRTTLFSVTARMEGTFPSEGLHYTLTIDDSRSLSLSLRNAVGKHYDNPVEVWTGVYDARRNLLEIFASGSMILPDTSDEEVTPDSPILPVIPQESKSIKLILWNYTTSPALVSRPDRRLTFRMDSPKSDGLSQETPDFAIKFAIIPEQIGFELLNKSSLPIRILWDECAYIDPSGRSFRVLHEGVRFIDRDKPMAATLVPPGASVRDLVYPTAYVSWTGSSWTQEPLFRSDQSVSFGVFLTLEIGGQKKGFPYKFAAVSTQPDWPIQIKSLFMP